MKELTHEDKQMLEEEGVKFKAQKSQFRLMMIIDVSILMVAEIAISIFCLVKNDTMEYFYVYPIIMLVMFVLQICFAPYLNKKMFYMLKMTDLEAGQEKLRLEEEHKKQLEQRDKR